jgi:hypothetical protein
VRVSLPVAAALSAALLLPASVTAKGGGAHGSYSAGTHGYAPAAGVARDSHGHIARNPHAKEEFRRSHPCPATGKKYGACPAWVVDHVQALKHGGADDPSNMQWQTTAQAKAKDQWE